MGLINIGEETEHIEYKKSTGELKEGVISVASILNKHGEGMLYFGVKNNGDVIGQKGKMINSIIEENDVKIDIDDEGMVSVCGINQEGIDNAVKTIKLIVEPIEIGKTYEGEVVRIMPFGAFVQITPIKDGMIHISKLSKERVEKVEDVVNIGDKVRVKVLGIDMGKISLSLKDAE